MRRTSTFALLIGLLAAPACTGGASCGAGTRLVDGVCVAVGAADTAADTAPDDEDTDVPDDDDTGDQDPVVLSFSADAVELTEGGSVTFVALVEDPQGDEDVALGALLTGDGLTYGAFSGGEGGRWTITVSWATLHALSPIDFAEEDERVFVAHFVDRSANSDDKSASVRLYCGGTAACGGVCKDTFNDTENCGACGNVCELCEGGQCHGYECVGDASTCDEACAAVGLSCGGDVCSGGTTTGYMIGDGGDTCDDFSVYRLVDECDSPFVEGYDLYGKCCCAG